VYVLVNAEADRIISRCSFNKLSMKNTCTTSKSAVCKPAQYLITLSTECFVNKKVDINIKVILYLGLKLG